LQAPLPRLIAITDVCGRGLEATLAALQHLCANAPRGSVAVQLRDNALPVARRLEVARTLRRVCSHTGQRLLVNDRADIAALCGADGLHLTENSVSAERIRGLPGAATWWLSRAWHDPTVPPDRAADALLLSPVLQPRKGSAALGLDVLRAACASAPRHRVYALGGIAPEDIEAILGTGAAGVAVQGALYDQPQALALALERCPV